jgi:hypothetical protein
MTQNSPVAFTDVESGTQLVTRLNNVGESFRTGNKGNSRPAYAVDGTEWWDSNTPTSTLNAKNVYDGSADAVEGYHETAGNRFYPALHRGAIHGLRISNNGTDALNDIDIAVGSCRDSTDVDDMHLLAALTKRLDATWAVGTGNGGLDTGAEAASTLYAVWLIKRSDTGVVDALFSTSFTAPTMPGSYDRKRLIGAVYNDGSSNLLAFTQSGDYFRYTGDIVQDVLDNSITADTIDSPPKTLSVPPLCLAHIYANLDNATETGGLGRLIVRTPSAADQAATTAEAFIAAEFAATTFDRVTASGFVLVDANRQVEYAASEAAGTATVNIRTIGFLMLTRSEP